LPRTYAIAADRIDDLYEHDRHSAGNGDKRLDGEAIINTGPSTSYATTVSPEVDCLVVTLDDQRGKKANGMPLGEIFGPGWI
jgi:hypothetical protein